MESDKLDPTPNKKRKTRITRSRNGCISCKKLKIKCDEAKPQCDYCIQTNRLCIYPKKPPVKLIKKDPTKGKNADLDNNKAIINKNMGNLNSMKSQLNVSKFELQLIKYYLDFGPQFFSFNVTQQATQFWATQVPKLWCESDLIKSAIYTVSSTRLLANYNYDDGSVNNVYFEFNESELDDDDNDETTKKKLEKVNLFKEVEKNIKKTNELIDTLLPLVTFGEPGTTEDLIGQLLIARKITAAAVAIYPGGDKSRGKLKQETNEDVSSFIVFDKLGTNKNLFSALMPYLPEMENTKYKYIMDTDQKSVEDCQIEFKFIQHLKDYVNKKVDALDPLQITFLEAISTLERGCKRTVVYKYPLPLCKIFTEISLVDDFLELFKAKNHIALKIIFHPICVLAMFDYKLYQKTGLTIEYMEFYKKYSFAKFNGDFEDEIDRNVYETVDARIKSKIPYDLNLTPNIGESVDDLLNGEFELMNLNAPDVFF